MPKRTKSELEQQVIIGAREYGLSTVLYRHAIGAKLGVNVTDMECLAALFFKGLSTPTELATYTGLSSGATTAMLDRLEAAGLIERRPNPVDRRGTLISIAKKSAKKLGPFFTPIRTAQASVMSNYSEKELLLVAGFLEKLTAAWEEERGKFLR